MIGVIGKDRTCPPKLFGQHCPRHQVRPGGLTEGDGEVRAALLLGRQAVGGADQEADFANALILPIADLRGELDGAKLFAGLVQSYDFGCRLKGRYLAARVG